MRAIMSLGSNLGDRSANLSAALRGFAREFPIAGVSSVYETAPVGAAASPPYLNLICFLDAVYRPFALLESVRRAETAAGRSRGRRFAPRTLDADIVCVGSLISESSDLILPHPRAHLRAFVLAPWLELDPSARLVRHGPVGRLLAQLGDQRLSLCSAGPAF